MTDDWRQTEGQTSTSEHLFSHHLHPLTSPSSTSQHLQSSRPLSSCITSSSLKSHQLTSHTNFISLYIYLSFSLSVKFNLFLFLSVSHSHSFFREWRPVFQNSPHPIQYWLPLVCPIMHCTNINCPCFLGVCSLIVHR